MKFSAYSIYVAVVLFALSLITPAIANADPFACGTFDDPSKSVTVNLTDSERELLNLAIPGYIADLTKEQGGAAEGGFGDRAFGLGIFIETSVPCIRDKINMASGITGQELEVTFGEFQRVAVQIMVQIWNSRDGVMSRHTRGCNRSRELRDGGLCQSFFPLADAADSLFRKVSRDQGSNGRHRDND